MAKTPYRSHGWRVLRKRVLERDHYECRIKLPGCLGRATEADHIVPLVQGGPWLDELNLRAACKPCNARRGNITKPGRETDPPPHAGPSREW